MSIFNVQDVISEAKSSQVQKILVLQLSSVSHVTKPNLLFMPVQSLSSNGSVQVPKTMVSGDATSVNILNAPSALKNHCMRSRTTPLSTANISARLAVIPLASIVANYD